MNEEHRKIFLEKFPDDKHNLITQLFCFAVRSGVNAVTDILAWVETDAKRRFDYADDVTKDAINLLLNLLSTQEAKDFANFIWWRESLPKEERLKQKYAQGRKYASEAMSKQAPTDKQLKYLQGLGCPIVPTNKQEASELIEKYK